MVEDDHMWTIEDLDLVTRLKLHRCYLSEKRSNVQGYNYGESVTVSFASSKAYFEIVRGDLFACILAQKRFDALFPEVERDDYRSHPPPDVKDLVGKLEEYHAFLTGASAKADSMWEYPPHVHLKVQKDIFLNLDHITSEVDKYFRRELAPIGYDALFGP